MNVFARNKKATFATKRNSILMAFSSRFNWTKFEHMVLNRSSLVSGLQEIHAHAVRVKNSHRENRILQNQ